MKRLGPVQVAILTLLSSGAKEFSEIVRTLTSISIPKSSIYTAIDELQKRGLIEVEKVYGKRLVKPKVDVGKELANIRKLLKERALGILNMILNILSSKLIDYDELEPDILERYREVLKEELRRVEEALSRWKRINVT